MSFIKQTLRPQIEVSNIFIGRNNELRFFVQHILKPKQPTYNIVSISGNPGVGKSILLSRLRDKARKVRFKNSCVTAQVDTRQCTPLHFMEQCATQLRMAGFPLPSFENALAAYKETMQHRQDEQKVARDAFLRLVPDPASSGVMGAQVIGGLYERVAEESSASYWDQRRSLQHFSETGQAHNPTGDLTQAFVEDLNWLAATQVRSQAKRTKRGLRLILFLDEFEPSATEVSTWLFNPFLQATLSKNVVLVVAGRDPIERFISNKQTLYSLPLEHFTRRETHTYLAARGIIETDRVAAIWQLSGGLPLSLSMLAFDPQGIIDTGTDAVTNVLRWIAGKGEIRQQLVLHAALFSRPFSQEDMEAFQYLPEQEQTSLYRWLVGLPFVQHNALNGRHCYHNLIQKQLSHTLSQLSELEYQLTRRALANHYRRQLEYIEAQGGKSIYSSAEWLELANSLVVQLFSLPDEASHVNAIEQIMTISYTKQEEDIIQALRSLTLEQPQSPANADVESTASLLHQYFDTDLASQEFLHAASELIEEVGHFPTFSASLLARMYGKRGRAHFSREEYQRAIADLDRALVLDSTYRGAYLLRGIAYSFLSAYRLAIEDFNHVLALDARETFAYAHRGIAHRKLKDYERALADFDNVLFLEPKLDEAHLLRSLTYQEFDESRRGLGNFDHLIEQNPEDASAYILRGMALCSLGEYERAIQNLNRALELEPANEQAYAGRGHVYLEKGDLGRARDDLRHSLERDPNDLDIKFLLEWIVMCMEGPDPEMPARLETMAAMKPLQYAAHVCRGVALALRERFEEALAELDRAIVLDSRKGGAFFWKCLTCALLKRDEDAVVALAQTVTADVPLPEVLLIPLRWLGQKRPGFYRKHIVPVLEMNKPARRHTLAPIP